MDQPEAKKKQTIKESIQIERSAILQDVKTFSESLLQQFTLMCNANEDTFNEVLKTVTSHETVLKGILEKMENIDEMMSLILVAVRQNEYLQTYYPAQAGFPAGKYVGLHPSKLMEKAQ